MPQARKSSIHFAPVTNIKFAVSHSERTELSDPGYLLPKEHQLPNILVDGSLSENELAELFIKQKESMTGQAKARGSSPMWEGVVVLKNTDGQEQSEYLKAWKVAYEKATGHKVLHMTIHFDEGYIDKAGAAHYNPHAHVIVSRMNEKNRVIDLKRKQLGEVQDLTADIFQMERGSTLKDRDGKRGRKHIPHNIFRDLANGHRLEIEIEKNLKNDYANWLDYKNNEYDLEKEKNKEANKVIAEKNAEIARLKLEHKAEFEQLKTEYATDRAELKASGEATQRDYQNLKKDHEAKVAELQEAHAEKVSELENKIQAEEEEKTKTLDGKNAEIARLKSEYAEEREALKASGTAKQSDYQQLKKDHEKAVAELAEARQEAARVPVLVDQVRAIEAQAATARQGRDEATAKAEQALVDAKGKDATQARQVTTLQADLLEARQQAAKAEQALVDAKGKDATQARQVTTLQAELGKVQAQATAAQQAQAQAARELAKAQADLAAAQQAHGVALAGKDAELGKERAKVAQAAQALAQAATEKTGFEQVIERLKATIEKLTKRIIGLDDKVTEMTAAAERDADKRALQEQRAMQVASPPSATQDRSSKAAAPQEEVRARLVEKYKSVAHGVAEGELSHASLGTATLVETQGGLAVYRVRGEHYIQQQPEQQKQGIQAKSGLGR